MGFSKKLIITSLFASGIYGCGMDSNSSQNNGETDASNQQYDIDIWPKLNIKVKPLPSVESNIIQILSNMTIEQKVAQMIQPEIRDFTVEDMRKYGFGSYLNGGGAFPDNNKHATPDDWITLAEAMYQASVDDSLDGSTIPTIWGTDAVHGHNNVIGATLFPHNIGLGAANNPELIEQIAKVTATEVMVTGIDWVFAPTVAVVRDDRWGRTYEGYSEDPEIVRDYSAAIVTGLQGKAGKGFLADDRVISTVKHFLGDGGTVAGDDQGDNIASEQELFDIHAQGYVGGLSVGAQSVMASFNSWHGEKLHGHKYLLTHVLKERMGFDGFVVGDWAGHGQIAGCTNQSCPAAINAGLDVFMVPSSDWKPLYENTLAQAKSGEIPMSRIDDAVSRVLRVKLRAGIFEKPSPANRQFSGKTELIGSAAHREVARQAVRESLVLLKNKNNLLPLNPKSRVLVAGDAADNIGKQSGGWTITWQGTNNQNSDFPGGSSIFDGIKEQVENAGGKAILSPDGQYSNKPDVAIVVYGEEPYAEGHGDRATLEYQKGDKSDLALLRKLKAENIPVISVFISGRPMWVNPELNQSDAFVAAWLPGSEGLAVADVLFTNPNGEIQYDFSGRLSYSWPKSPLQATVNRNDEDYAPLLPYGFGLSYGDENLLGDSLNEEISDAVEDIQDRVFFDGKVHKPWEMALYSGAKNTAINANAHQLAGVSYRTIDRKVQEDSMLLSFNGSEKAGLRINSESNFREDLSAELISGAKLTFLARVTDVQGEVYILMNCEGFGDQAGSCESSLEISDALKQLEPGSWQQLAIPLSCFADKGIRFGEIVTPFNLWTESKLDIALAEVKFSVGSGEGAAKCPE
ncbi:glycoside hydrolase family 3 protein [Thalassotalea litorea]|uniref:glycoside hydrolase family 3 protein n=1 Tax=Thalassotalea litorea TaxID=2020715 RepID=UPI003735E6B9